ncbi:MAG: hypothetical protein LBF26_01290 [Puniceicoccales bacterium]|jgi:hypothetical protein|nr:hypothetical protein [Puniceicoccales bacterium]
MAVQVITLRQVFDHIFVGKNTLDYDALCALMDINDTYNRDVYSTDESFSSIDAAMRNYEFTMDDNKNFSGFVLYSRTIGGGGKDVWTQVMNPDARIPSSVELYLKKIGPNNKEGYVQVYALRQLDLNNFLIEGTNQYRSYYADISTRTAGALYALCCYQKKLMELHIRDIEAINKEQMEVNRILSVLSSIKNELTQVDVGVTEILKRNKRQIDPDVLAFFATRRLLDNLTQGSCLGLDRIASLRRMLSGADTSGKLVRPTSSSNVSVEDVDSTGDYTLGLVNSFKAWVCLHTLLKHYGMFFVTKRGTINGVSDCDVYAPQYWQKASEMATNARIGMAGVGDHWIFVGDPSVRWFGNDPPSGATEFETRIAGTLARSYGGINFIEPDLFTKNNENQWIFDETFKSALEIPTTAFTVYSVLESSGDYKEYFYVSFRGAEARYNGTQIAHLTISNYDPGDYWKIGNKDAFTYFVVGSDGGNSGINGYGRYVQVNGEDCVFWEDAVSLYTSQISSLSSSRCSEMQMALQSSQQSLSMGTNMSKSIARARLEVIGNTR